MKGLKKHFIDIYSNEWNMCSVGVSLKRKSAYGLKNLNIDKKIKLK